jgi:hypothetical protein
MLAISVLISSNMYFFRIFVVITTFLFVLVTSYSPPRAISFLLGNILHSCFVILNSDTDGCVHLVERCVERWSRSVCRQVLCEPNYLFPFALIQFLFIWTLFTDLKIRKCHLDIFLKEIFLCFFSPLSLLREIKCFIEIINMCLASWH